MEQTEIDQRGREQGLVASLVAIMVRQTGHTAAHLDTADWHLRRILAIADEVLGQQDRRELTEWGGNARAAQIQSATIGELITLRDRAQAALNELAKRPPALRYGALGNGGGQS